MKLKKTLGCLAALLLAGSLSSCEIWGVNGGNGSGEGGCNGLPGKDEWTIDDVNEFLNQTGGEYVMKEHGNPIAVIPFNHINGPRSEWKFFALVNYEYNNINYWKYQITFLSCTCRTADVNYWSTVFLTLGKDPVNPDSGDVRIRQISFEKDDTDHYQAGFWGDSSPIPNSTGGTGENGAVTYEDIRDGFIQHLEGLMYSDIKDWSTEDDIKNWEPNTDAKKKKKEAILKTIGVPDDPNYPDTWTGASVSTNNIIRILQAACEYHIKQGRNL